MFHLMSYSYPIKPSDIIGIKEMILVNNNLVAAFQSNWVSLVVSIIIIGFLVLLAKKELALVTVFSLV